MHGGLVYKNINRCVYKYVSIVLESGPKRLRLSEVHYFILVFLVFTIFNQIYF